MEAGTPRRGANGPGQDESGGGKSAALADDRRGRQTTISANGATLTRTLNDAGSLLSESFSGGPLNGLAVTNGYDSYLRRTALGLNTQPGTLTQFGYDSASRLQSVTNGALSATYGYLANSPLVSQIGFTNSGVLRMTTTKQHDLLNRLTAIESRTGVAPVSISQYAYNTASQRTAVTNADGCYWIYIYDSLGQVTSGKKYWADGTPVAGQQFEYNFDDIGNRTWARAGGDNTGANLRQSDYYPNLLNQYWSNTVPGWVQMSGTANSNAAVTLWADHGLHAATARKGDYYRGELGVTNTAGPLWLTLTNLAVLNNGTNADILSSVTGNVFVARTPQVFRYDPDGNLTNDGRWSYTWDAENRLKQVESLSTGPTASKRKVVWEFDGQGRRIRQTTYDGSSGSFVVTEDLKFLSDGWAHVAELNVTNNALVRSYAWGLDLSGSQAGAGGVGGLLVVNSTANGAHFCAYDGNGNVVALVRTSDGTESARYEYGPFGETVRATGPMAKENPFRFATKRTDNTTDFVLYEYRLYSPILGRWLSRDPLEEAGGCNILGFCANNPVADTDQLGLKINKTRPSGRNYRLFRLDAVIWDTIVDTIAPKLSYSFVRTAMQHAEGTIAGNWDFNKAETEKVRGTRTYAEYLQRVETQLRLAFVGPREGLFEVSTPEVNLNFKDYDGNGDLAHALGHVRFKSKGTVSVRGRAFGYCATITLTDYYTFAVPGYASLAWYTPTPVGVRLETHGWTAPYSIKGEWYDTIASYF